MTELDEFLGPLDKGVWEVTIPKQSVTEPLDAGWKKSAINVPSPGTLNSYRKGRYHVHETGTEWKVHLDNYDPEIHPYLHLIDDAPLLLMIGDTFVTLIAGTRKKSGNTNEILAGQERTWQQQVISGIFIMIFGVLIIFYPLAIFSGIVTVILPLTIIALGCITIWDGFNAGRLGVQDRGAMYRGCGIVMAGIIVRFMPVDFWGIVIILILAVWMFASALVLLTRATKGRAAVPEGFVSRIIIAIISLFLGILIFVEPSGVLRMLMIIVGTLALLIGFMLLVNGIRLRKRMKHPIIDI
ncbi:MAG TPA: DUF308 domain-containing protein [Methanoregulaceae archaeon]|nr:DUF308 domain-containing protein [Methanoregulaceae archaeon]